MATGVGPLYCVREGSLAVGMIGASAGPPITRRQEPGKSEDIAAELDIGVIA
jgi:hypothetical protein